MTLHTRFWLLSLILLAFALRLTLLGEQSLWYDEGVTWMLSQMNLPDLIEWTAADIQPPLYYLLIWSSDILLGDSEWALRFPSVIFNLLTLPALYVLARRLFPAHRTVRPLLAVALLAGSPLLIYYSQEARMYTLLTLEATLASYLLLKITPPPPQASAPTSSTPYSLLLTPYSLLYALTAAAALYTHYFALFLLLAHGLYALLAWSGHRFALERLPPLLVGFGGALLLFAPWLPTLLARLGDDPSYWPGALKLDEALRKILISFTAGETVLEQTGWPLTLAFAALLLPSLLLLLLQQKDTLHLSRRGEKLGRAIPHPLRPAALPDSNKTPSPQTPKPPNPQTTHPHSPLPTPYSLLLLWLLLPIGLILLLSLASPKFNPRYALLAWPALALLLAALLSRLWALFQGDEYRWRRFAGLGLFSLTVLFILSLNSYSLLNWFTDPRFSKDDFQALAQFVQERRQPDETVLLSSGHLFPVWAYYYGWEGWTPLPWMLRLDVSRVTTLEIAAEIKEAVQDKGGVWLVTWQDEVIDPTGVIPFWLDRIGERPIDAGDFWGVGLEHWRLNPRRLDLLEQDPIERRVGPETVTGDEPTDGPAGGYNFANQVDLLGLTQLSDRELILFWRPRQSLPETLLTSLDLTDPRGFSWDRETLVEPLGRPSYPPHRWPVDQTIITRHRLPWQIGTPPGLYTAEIGLGLAEGNQFSGWDVLDHQGRPWRRTALLDHINLSDLVEPPGGPLPLDKEPVIDLLPLLAVRRVILPQNEAQPGDRILLALLWQAGEYNVDDVSVAFDLIDAEGQSFRVGSSYTPSRQFSLPRWRPGDTVLGQYWLDIPPEAAPGPADLQLHVINVTGYFYDEVYPFAQLEIRPTERTFTPPATVDIPLQADFSGQARLLGVDCPAGCRTRPGDSLTLTLYWQAQARFNTAYTVFTHLLDPAETVLLNADHAPPKPTTAWVPGEIIADPVTLTLPPDLPPGAYPVELGLYNAADPAFTRLPLTDGSTRLILPQPLVVE